MGAFGPQRNVTTFSPLPSLSCLSNIAAPLLNVGLFIWSQAGSPRFEGAAAVAKRTLDQLKVSIIGKNYDVHVSHSCRRASAINKHTLQPLAHPHHCVTAPSPFHYRGDPMNCAGTDQRRVGYRASAQAGQMAEQSTNVRAIRGGYGHESNGGTG